MKLIGFTGPAGSGKTTMANAIEGQVKKLSFATPLKETIIKLFDLRPYQVYTPEGKEGIDKRYGTSPRKLMQKFGTDFVRNTVPNLWVLKMEKELKKALNNPFNDFVTIDDIRFEDEADLVRRFGGTVVHIVGRNEVKVPPWWKFWEEKPHPSELPINIDIEDWMVDNSGKLENVPWLVQTLIEEIERGKV